MQQPMNQQQEQMGCQQVSQQMMLCPVRLVYETQILVPPGDQVQPNQTFFINPQNPPPWMQNRSVPNQVVYVQQLPNNIMSTTQQHIDQNQFYLHQNFGNFQLQPQMLAQSPQDLRPTMQLTNLVPNMVQNVQQTMSNDRNVGQNMTSIPQMQSNAPNQIPNQMNLANVRLPQVNQTMDSPKPVLMNMRPQISQQTNVRPVMAMNQLTNMPMQQTLSNMQSLQFQPVHFNQNLSSNGGQTRTVQPQSIVSTPRAVQPTNIYPNQANIYPNMQSVTKVRDTQPEIHKNISNVMVQSVANSMPIINNVATNSNRNFIQSYAYRPIQPRPPIRHVNSNMAQVQPKVQTTVHTTTNVSNMVQVQPKVQSNIQNNTNMFNSDKNNIPQNVVGAPPSNFYRQQEIRADKDINTNRKRKSESPDEIQKKIAVTRTVHQSYQSITVTKLSNEVGVNTSPVHRINNKNVANKCVQNNPNSTQIVVKPPMTDNNLNKYNVVPDIIPTPTSVNKTPIPAHVIDTEKMIRNTVYTQARGRLMQDKKTAEESMSTEQAETKSDIKEKKADIIDKEINVTVTPDALSKESLSNTMIDAKEEKNPVDNPEVDATIKKLLSAGKEEDMNKDIPDIKDTKFEEFSKITIKSERDYNILTHVVDGYVIQESNIAFPIRRPLKEKTIFANTLSERDSKDRNKDDFMLPIDLPLLPLHYLHLNNDPVNEPEEVKEEAKENGNPFCKLQQTTVKSWTTDDLAEHLSKFKWKETVSVLQDHEIDGESLFLVSRSQLITIGVPENHAELICQFVKS